MVCNSDLEDETGLAGVYFQKVSDFLAGRGQSANLTTLWQSGSGEMILNCVGDPGSLDHEAVLCALLCTVYMIV